MLPLVSVIIPVYNGEKYIDGAIKSVLRQDYPNIEIIVVDDGSFDNTKAVIKTYKNKVKYFYKKNGGVASARNCGIKVANGKFIAFLDCDDLYTEDKVSKQVEVLLENPYLGFVYNDIDVIDYDNRFLYTLKSEEIFEKRKDMLAYVLYRQTIPGAASVMIRRTCLADNIYYPEEYSNSEDYLFTIRLLMKSEGKYLNESLYLYRRHERNLTNNHSKQKECEKNIIKELGINTINHIVEASNFDTGYKKLLLSKIYYKIDEKELAYKKLKTVDKENHDFEYFFHKGVCEYALKKYDKAIDSFIRTFSFETNKAEVYNNLGCCYLCMGDKLKAEENFRDAHNLNKDYLDAKINLNNICSNIQDIRFTERSLRKVLTKY